MPRTRIRGRAPFSVTTGGGTTGTSANPPGSSLTTDDIGSIEIMLAEAAAVPTSAELFLLSVTQPGDTSALPADDVGDYLIINQVADPASVPTGAHATSIEAGATTVTQTTGTGWTNPANAQGVPDASTSVLNSAAGLNPPTVTGTLTGVFASLGTPSTETQTGTVTLTVYADITVGLLATGSLAIAYSTDSGANYTTISTQTATFAGPFTATLTGFLIANLDNLRFRAVGTVKGAALTAATATVDAAVASFTTTGSPG